MINKITRKKTIEQIGKDLNHHQLYKTLYLKDLIVLGIAAIIGAGIFSTIGKAAYNGGPSVIFLFILTAIACSFAALSYAEFSSMIPASGSAYTYTYVSFGELAAWIIGWSLIMEYAIGNITVAKSWSDYFTSFFEHTIPIPKWLCTDYLSAKSFYEKTLSSNFDKEILKSENYNAWVTSPVINNIKIIFDLPAILISLVITILVYKGIRESKRIANYMVLIKVIVVLLVIIVGAFYINTENWNPFAPNGVSGILSGVSAIFFSYIGFDAISTTAEECKNPQRDLPRGMIASIIICTILYILITLVLTGMVSYKELNLGDPLLYVFKQLNIHWMINIIGLSAIIAMASVLLVFQLGQPRIWMVMSRDGLLPKKFSKIHPKYKTPSFATIITGLVVIIPCFFITSDMVTDMCSIGTLFAFVLVCAGVLVLQVKNPTAPKKFKIPYINAQYIYPTMLIFIVSILLYLDFNKNFEGINHILKSENKMEYFTYMVFSIFCVYFIKPVVKYRLSLIPTLGLVMCLYLMTELGWKNWLAFTIWLIIGLFIYFGYSINNSLLNKKQL